MSRAVERHCVLVGALVACASVITASASSRVELPLGGGLRGSLHGTSLQLEVEARPGDGWWTMCQRLTGDGARHAELARANGGRSRLVAGARYSVPKSAWPDGAGARLITALFPQDRAAEAGWVHVVTDGRRLGRSESPWVLAQLFVGDGNKHGALQIPKTVRKRGLRPGDEVVIPWDVLLPHLHPGEPRSEEAANVVAAKIAEAKEEPAATAVEPVAKAASTERDDDAFAPKPGTRSDDGALAYARDEKGGHAVYRLRSGEALYSDVVLRFTGHLSGADVNLAAHRIARRSGIADVTDIAVGHPVLIPFEELRAEFLPVMHPRRLAWEAVRAESDRLAQLERRKNLDGVHVVLDIGHGGLDPGALSGRVWEDDYAYDVACRIRARLQDATLATVHALVKDKSSGFAPLSRIKRDSDEVLLTNPQLALDEPVPSGVPVNLRWLLANDIRRRLVAKGVDEDQIVFLSIHADSLHPSARGSMVYFPEAALRVAERGVKGTAYRRFAEAKSPNAFRMDRKQRLRAEGLSRRLGESIIAAVREAELEVHRFKPVRGHVVRGRPWIPAVIKYNQIPASVLFETVNMNNGDDQTNLRDPAFRQALAESVVRGLVSYFGEADDGSTPVRRASRR